MIWEGSHPHPRIEYGAGSVCTGTTVGFPGFPRRAGEGGFQTRPYGSRSRGGVTLTPVSSTGQAPPSTVEGEGEAGTPHQVPIRRGQRADTWVRPYGSRSRGVTLTPVSSTGQASPSPVEGEGGEGTPHQVPVRRGQRADTWVRPYARRSGGHPHPRIEYGAGSRPCFAGG